MHGGASPGAPRGKANGNYKTGRFTCEAIEQRGQLAAWIRAMSHMRPGERVAANGTSSGPPRPKIT